MPSMNADLNLQDEAIGYYQYSSEWKSRLQRIPTIYENKKITHINKKD